ncbi:MAG: precorrin-2 C(20)-methyltransferase [Spirochaetaceae bacterium]|jgi:precorrin-2/cobalt-factor-2 C20-methyltransferase|nr:precorrin-2 C(20)-methyltransferase [Spirochaetaceae bacterium]
MKDKGILYGTGVGPGDPELITVKALKTMAACDYVAFIDPGSSRRAVAYEIARAALPEIERKEKIRLDIPMTTDKAAMRSYHVRALALIAEKLNAGSDVCFLSLGDISVYSTFGYLRKLAREAGFETRAVSGIPSFCASAAALDIDLALGEQNLHIFCASDTNLDAALALGGTRVFMKGPSGMPRVIEAVKKRVLDAALVSNCGMENEILVASVRGMGECKGAGYYSLIIVRDGEGGKT